MANWVLLEDRMPTDCDTISGRVPILDTSGYLGYAVLAGAPGYQFLVSDLEIEYWLEAMPPHPEE